MDEFLVVLIFAFAIIGLMMVFGTPLAEWAGTAPSGGSESYEIANYPYLGRVGQGEGVVSRSEQFGSFSLGESNTEELNSMPSFTVQSPAFGAQDTKKFDPEMDAGILDTLKGIRIGFDVNDDPSRMSSCSNLRIRWNDRVVFDKVPRLFHYDVSIDPSYVGKTNVLEFEAVTPPPWQIWCWNSVYTLDNFVVEADYGPEKFLFIELHSSEMASWDRGVLSFYTTSGQSGELIILMNGREVFRKSDPEHLETLEFDYSDVADILKIGDNVIAFKSGDVFSIDDVRFDIYLSTDNVVQTKDFEMTESELGLLSEGEGEIYFDIDSIYKEGVFSIKINGNSLNLQALRDGHNSVGFGEDDVSIGSNTLKFSGTGSWDVSNVTVKINH